MVNMFWNSQGFVFSGGYFNQPDQKEEFKKISANVSEFALYADTRRVYLPETVCASVDNFVEAVRSKVIYAGVYGRESTSVKHLEKYEEILLKACEVFQKEIPALRKALEVEFRKMLGVEDFPPAIDSSAKLTPE
jgi:hypothetical protein